MTVKTQTSIQEKLLPLIDQHLDQIDLPQNPERIYTPFRYVLNLGGKRVRPYTVLLGCGICGGEVKQALPAALAVELLHNFTLVHDDIMDKAATRRGKPSVHAKWSESTAILTGDMIFSKAMSQLLYYGQSKKFNKNTYNLLHQTFLEAVDTVCEGQALDLDFADRDEVSLGEYLNMITKKTAFMVGASLKMGAIVAAEDDEDTKKLFDIGRQVGIAFQIQDDMLDVAGNPEKFGKDLGGDIREGKKTYLSILASQRANTGDQKFIDKVLRKKNVEETKIEQVMNLYRKYGVIKAADETIQEHYSQALDTLETFSEGPYKSALINLINRLGHRER